jgi:hydroxymethylbilane synthase
MATLDTDISDNALARSAPPRQYLPLGVNVAGLRCLVVGGGRVGARKAETLAAAGAKVTVVSPAVADRLRPLIDDGTIEWLPAVYHRSQLPGCSLVIAATPDPAINLQIGSEAELHGVLSCVVSPGRHSRVIFPAVCSHDDVTVAVHTNGRDCLRSREVRDHIRQSLNEQAAVPGRPAVFGVRRHDLPPDIFERLTGATHDLRQLGGTPVLILATCWRWECYFVAPSARALTQDILQYVEDRCGILLERYRPALYTRHDAGAVYHLLRVAAGLDSPVLGETEIVGQVRAALDGVPESSPLHQTITSALQAQKRIRAESGISAGARAWAGAAVTKLEHELGGLAEQRIALVGCGRLAELIASQLIDAGAVPLPVSRRAQAGVEWCARLGLDVFGDDELDEVLAGADAAVISTPGTAGAATDIPVIDLTDGRSLPDLAQPQLSGDDVTRAEDASRLALLHAIRLHRQAEPAPSIAHPIRVGARPSALSHNQVGELRNILGVLLPGVELNAIDIHTPGDRDKATPLPTAADDFFTRDLDDALRSGRIDLAVHSAKDLPERIPDGLCVAALLPSAAPWDCLVTRHGESLADLPPGARAGTSSDRRQQQLLQLRPDLEPADIRGNVPDRVRQLDAGDYDALVLAVAGLVRLGLSDRIAQVFSLDEFPVMPGQGSLALLVRRDDAELRRLLAPLDIGDRRGLPWA